MPLAFLGGVEPGLSLRIAPCIVPLLFDDPELNRGGDVRMQPHLDIVDAQLPDAIFKVDGTALDLVAFCFQQLGDILHGDRTEETILFADLDLRGERISFQLLGDDFGGTTLGPRKESSRGSEV